VTWLDGVTFETVIVHMTENGPSLKAPRVVVMDDCIVLRDAILLEPEGTEMLNGEIVVPREKVLFVQKVGS
jgi:proline racemase